MGQETRNSLAGSSVSDPTGSQSRSWLDCILIGRLSWDGSNSKLTQVVAEFISLRLYDQGPCFLLAGSWRLP